MPPSTPSPATGAFWQVPVRAPNEHWEASPPTPRATCTSRPRNKQPSPAEGRVLRMDEPTPHGPAALVRPDHAWELSFPSPRSTARGCSSTAAGLTWCRRCRRARMRQSTAFGWTRAQPRRARDGRPCRWLRVTAADISARTRVAILSTKSCACTMCTAISTARDTTPARIPLRVPNELEGCCFARTAILVPVCAR